MRIILFLFFLVPFSTIAQNYSLHGKVLDEKGNGIPFSTVALLYKSDSTLAFFAVTKLDGDYTVSNIVAGDYILQISFLGYNTYYRDFPVPNEKLNSDLNVALVPATINLPEAEIKSERIPITFHGDTIEYNAISYKTQPDAVVEDLLKKLPGIEIDRNGNIKAQGEDVKKVTVDGKEFFGNDPKVATKNLPADAIQKVQVYDSKSNQAQLTGIDDGQRDKTIDLKLKDDRKNSWFGELKGGIGTEDHYQSSAKVYRFTPEQQIAALGMLNNINKFGFSFSDYMDFNGGFGNGGEMTITNGNNSFPIDFGDSENGLITSGGGGLNYSYEKKKDNRFHASYLVNGVNKNLEQQNQSKNYTGGNNVSSSNELESDAENRSHNLTLGWKNRIDSMKFFYLNVTGLLNGGNEDNVSLVKNFISKNILSGQNNANSSDRKYYSGEMNTGYLKRFNSKWKLIDVDFTGKWNMNNTERQLLSSTTLNNIPGDSILGQDQSDRNEFVSYKMKASVTRKTGNYTYLDGIVTAQLENEKLSNEVLLNQTETIFPGGELNRLNQYSEMKLKFKRVKNKSRSDVAVATRYDNQSNDYFGDEISKTKLFILPSLSWEKEYQTSRRLMFYYFSSLQNPSANQLYPPLFYDPLNVSVGNRNLRPEQHHDVRVHWSIFDQFSFRSLFAAMSFGYVHDKISWERITDENFVQSTRLLNVDDDYESGLSAEFSTPIKKLGLTFNLSVDEKLTNTVSYINHLKNDNTILTHEPGFSIENRKKNKWDVSAGVNWKFVDSKYKLDDIPDQRYSEAIVFADLNFNPNESWHLGLKADFTKYFGKAFDDKINVPLLRAEISYSFLKSKRGALIIDAFDLLNRNTGIERVSEYNYLLESKSNTIQRYVMISFRYRLNKFASKDKVDVKVK